MKKSIFKTVILISALVLAAAPVFSQAKRTQSKQTQQQRQPQTQIKRTPSTAQKKTTSTQSYWDGAPAVLKETPFKFEGGTGTLKDPYLIKTAEQLNSVRFGLSKHYKLIADIDLSKWGNWIPL